MAVERLIVLTYLTAHRTDDMIDPSDYALLYDRVHLKTSGRQLYASQMQCVNGTLEPKPLEDPQHVDALRAGVKLPSLAGYRKSLQATYGKKCS